MSKKPYNIGIRTIADLTELRRAVDDATLASKKSPSDPVLMRELADATAELGFESGFLPELRDHHASLLDDAIALYQSVIRQLPNDGVLLNNLGVAQSDRGFHCAAVSTFRRALALIPQDRNVHFNLAVALMNTNSDGRIEARSHFETANKLQRGHETRRSYFDAQGH